MKSTLLTLAMVVAPVTALCAQASHGLATVSFLSGCWSGTMEATELREQWSEPDGGAMLGTTRFLKDGQVVDWEFGRLIEEGGRATLWPYPQGRRSEHGFPLARIQNGEYVFENLEHDFPVRIIYIKSGPDELGIRIEGSEGQVLRGQVRRVACPYRR